MKLVNKNKVFTDRKEAGREPAEKLDKYKARENLLILALPRGGVPVAFEAAKSLGTHLDVFITRKLRFTDNPELAVGGIGRKWGSISERRFERLLPGGVSGKGNIISKGRDKAPSNHV